MKKFSHIYTKFGDTGTTRTLSGDRVSKDDVLIEVNGDIDSLQVVLDKLIAFSLYSDILLNQKEILQRVQTLLWQLGGEISQSQVGGFVTNPISDDHVVELESQIESFELSLDGFQRFSNLAAIEVNEARVRTRRLERTLTQYLRDRQIRDEVYRYINRLSDYFFALAVKVQDEGVTLS